MTTIERLRENPWVWVPTIFFMQGFPGYLIMGVLAIMYNNFNVPVSKITFYTGLMVLPWTIRPIWAAFIDILMTKRWWIYMMQIVFGICFIIMGVFMKSQNFFIISVVVGIVATFVSATHDIASDGLYVVRLRDDQQSFFLGIQSSAYSIGRMAAQGGIVMLSGCLFVRMQNYNSAWTISLIVAGIVCIMLGIYHVMMLPSESVEHKVRHTVKTALIDYWDVCVEFFKIERLGFIIVFMFFYRIGQVFLETMLPIFMTSPLDKGGLGLTNQFTGFAYGMVAPIAIVVGGLIGGWVIYKRGVRHSIWLMFISMNATHILYITLSYYQTTNLFLISSVIAVEQFTSSFAFAAYYIILMYCVRNSRFKTAHFAFFNALMMLTIMIPKMFCGWIQELLGYTEFFIFVLLTVIPGILVVKYLKIDEKYGKHNYEKNPSCL